MRFSIGVAMGLIAATMGPVAPASAAAPAAPVGLSVQQPDAATATLTWQHVDGATKYNVQVDDDPNFGSPASIPSSTITTVNNTYVPTGNLPSGTKYWRVRAQNAVNEASDWSIGSFGTPEMSVPQPASPSEGAILSQPSQPPLLTWTSSPGATSYIVEVDGDSDFVGAFSYTTKSTSLVVPDPLPSGTIENPADYYWRVTASKGNGINSLPSPPARFIIGPLPAPEITSPPNNAGIELQDVVLDWKPVEGAKSYDVEVATNSDFNAATSVTNITGTRYSPPMTFDNDQYYWRVRARDLDDKPTPWTSSIYAFNRTWPAQPQAVFPAEPGIESVPAPMYFEWTSVPHASEYELQVSSTPGFADGTFNSCRTAGTTYTPGMFAVNTTGIVSAMRVNEDCEPYPGQTNYWKVRPLDRPFTKGGDIAGVQGIFSEPQAFLYNPVQLTGMTPTAGATVDVPTLRWEPQQPAETYKVTIRRNNGNEVDSATTRATSYTPDGTTPLPTDGNPYTWEVTATSTDGIKSVTYRHSFNVSGNAPTPPASAADYLKPTVGVTADGPYSTVPALTWEPHPGAARYQVRVGNAMDSSQIWFGHNFDDLFAQNVPYNSMTDTSAKLLLPGSYDWQVTALDAQGVPFAVGPEGRFTVAPAVATSEHALALGGRELDANNPATKTPCDPLSGPCVVPSTPVLKWKAQPDVSFYMVYVSRDASFTNLLEPSNAIPATTNSMYAPALDNRFWTYPDTEAGEALYWFVRPCRRQFNCADSPVSTIGNAQHSFTKTSPKVEGLESSDPAGTEITFSWDDYYDTNRASTWDQTGEDRPQSAMQYRIQVDDTQSFGTGSALVDERVVDQATYTAFDKLYPEGTLYWRVQAIDSKGDSSGNGNLAWSDTQTFVKKSPRVGLTAPVDNATVAGTVALRWEPQAFAREYKVEVYKNNDTTFSSANLVFSKTVRTTAYAHNEPLPASPTPYVWRVRRVDTRGNLGPWSWSGGSDPMPVGRFTVSKNVMEITSPAPGAIQAPNGPVLSWRSLPGAVSYTVEVNSSSGSPATVAQTVATSYAPTTVYKTGVYSWQVTAKDAANNAIGSAQGSFSVDDRLQATSAPQIAAPAGTGVGATLTSTPPVWNESGVTETYQWLRDGAVIFGATDPTYTLTTADYLKPISLRVTGKKAGFSDGVTISNVIGATAGGALQATVQPAISGTAASGSALRVTPGTWSQPGPAFKYQWLRTGAPIPGANSATYLLSPEDAGKDVSVTVLASKAGFADGSATAPAVAVDKLKSTVIATLSKTRVKPGKRVRVGITVTVPGVKGPEGVIKIMDRAKKIKKVRLLSYKDGKMRVKLPKLKRGKHRIKVKYLGNASTKGSRSKAMGLLVSPR